MSGKAVALLAAASSLAVLWAGCGVSVEGIPLDTESSALKWDGGRESDNVIDLRPRPCANPNNCVAGLLPGQCPAGSPPGSTGQYNSGLCQVDSNENLTTLCHISTRCCSDLTKTPGFLGCDWQPFDAGTPADAGTVTTP